MPRPTRSSESYARRGAQREPYDVVLIVCEGEKTEPQYLQGLRRAWKLSSANIHVRSPGASDPPNLAAYALRELESGDYDRAFCVFDRDTHAGFEQALNTIEHSAAGQAGRLSAVVSWPCFEIWVLLHFAMTTRAFNACADVIREIRRHYAGYAKGSAVVFADLEARLDAALVHAGQLRHHNQAAGGQNPSTAVDELVTYLKNLKA